MHCRFACCAVFAALVAGCSSTPDAPQIDVVEAHAAIQGGYLDETDTHVVGIIHISNSNFGACSGTLIAPNVVLTAHHCVAPTSGDGGVQCGVTTFGNNYVANQLYVTTQTEFTQNPSDYHGTYEILVPPGGSTFCGNDQALLILDEIIDASEAVYAVPRVDEPLLAGEEYYAVGFGQQFDSGNAPSGIRQRRDFLYTQCVGSECEMSSIADAEWRGDTGVCSGDSGGPAFDVKHRVTGVASRGAPGCEFPIYGYPLGWAQWLKDSVIYASGLAGLAPPPWATGYPTDPAYSHPVGGACNGDPINCPSGACVNDYCTRQCNELAPCPEDYDCSPDGWCVQIPEPEPKKKAADDATSVSSCGLATPGLVLSEDPTKPIPWKWAAALLGAAWLVRRRD